MASRSKQKTTMAKLNRERALQQRRLEKQARKDARRQAADGPASQGGAPEQALDGIVKETERTALPPSPLRPEGELDSRRSRGSGS
jgi:hypothetical protein